MTLTALVAEALQQALGTRVPSPGEEAAGRARASAAGRLGPTSRGGRAGEAEANVAERVAESMRWFEANRGRLLRRYRDSGSPRWGR